MRPEQAGSLVYRRACPTCHAPAGRGCVRPCGLPRSGAHAARKQLARDARRALASGR